MRTLTIKSGAGEDLIDITHEVRSAVQESTIKNGICIVFVPHTTAAITINENADPDVRDDILMGLEKMVPTSLPWEHSEGNSPAHVKAALLGSSVHVIIEGGELRLGTWQGIFVCEFDGPRQRHVFIEILPRA